MNINEIIPASGRMLAEDGSVINIVDILNAGGGVSPVSSTVYDINVYAPRTGRVVGEDGKAYNLVDLLSAISGGGDGNSNLAWLPNVSESGTISWTRSTSLSPPMPRNIVGPPGEDGAGKVYTHTQDAAAASWYIQHNFNEPSRALSIFVTNEAGSQIIGQVNTEISTNNLLVYVFSQPLAGLAYIKF